ncbi:hypothetical protein J6590_068675 [Homalodisca vitripennis]|nr:hypothetical protein J6590_068675 [Homalodisca vitripennis]
MSIVNENNTGLSRVLDYRVLRNFSNEERKEQNKDVFVLNPRVTRPVTRRRPAADYLEYLVCLLIVSTMTSLLFSFTLYVDFNEDLISN